MRIIWNLFLVVIGLMCLVVSPPFALIPIVLYFVFKPKQQPQQPQQPTVVILRDKD